MNNRELEDLYHATEEAMQFAIGLLALPSLQPEPYIHIHYGNWTREMLEVVRESFKGGLIVVTAERKPGQHHLYIGTRETIAMQARQNGHTSVLRAPAWDAHLPNIDPLVVDGFEADRRRFGGFLLLIQTPEWEFMTAVQDGDGRTTVGPIEERSLPMPEPSQV